MRKPAAMDRHIPFDQCFNFRDMGGYETRYGRSVKWRQLFRSDSLHYMTPEDAGFARRNLGVRSVFDLRSLKEVEQDGKGLLIDGAVRYYHVPLVEVIKRPQPREPGSTKPATPVDYTRGYYRVAVNAGPRIAGLLKTIAQAENCPAVCHCSAGKDRTGIVAAILLGLLGVSDEDIVSDYVLSDRYADKIAERVRNSPFFGNPQAERTEATPERSRPRAPLSPPDRMWGFLEAVRGDFASMEAFASSMGVEAETVRRLREHLLFTPTQTLPR